MKTIGLIGGMSWESTAKYYALINEGIQNQLGGSHSANIVLNSLDFAQIEAWQRQDEWTQITNLLADSAQQLESSGCDLIGICSNTVHRVADQIQQKVNIPIVNIIDVIAQDLRQSDIRKIGLLGTKYTMTQGFFIDQLKQDYSGEVICPIDKDRDTVHRIIFEELCQGEMNDASRGEIIQIVKRFEGQGATGVLLACTELGMIIKQADVNLTIYDSTVIHAQALIASALSS